MRLIVTGGLGFIGSAVIRMATADSSINVLNIDSMTYAAQPDAVREAKDRRNYSFLNADICDLNRVKQIFREFKPHAVMHLAAESHVDNSILAPSKFIETNVIGTYNLLEAARGILENQPESARKAFRFHHVSTDEVFGDLASDSPPFNEHSSYAPSSPYSASKASSDHLVRAWHRTYDLPVVITNCSNNYGPYQHPEKFIPKVISRVLEGLPIPVYGDGLQIRDWLYVDDHARALLQVLKRGVSGETYNIGGCNEVSNIEVVRAICAHLDKICPDNNKSGFELIQHVEDRPGHDRRYAIDSTKIQRTLNWHPVESFETGIIKTVEWYVGLNT